MEVGAIATFLGGISSKQPVDPATFGVYPMSGFCNSTDPYASKDSESRRGFQLHFQPPTVSGSLFVTTTTLPPPPRPCRLRTPNEWDTLSHWQDVLLWRNHIYNVVINAFNTLSEIAPQLHQMGYRDKAWSVNKMGHIAYK